MDKDPIKISGYVGILTFVISVLYLYNAKPETVIYINKKGEKKIDSVILLLISIIVGITASIIAFFVLSRDEQIKEEITPKVSDIKIEKSNRSSDIKDLI
jgi:hypothetical protein